MPARQSAASSLSYHRANELSAARLEAMWALLGSAVQADRAQFERGLREMDEVWLYEVEGVVKGFGGVKVLQPAWKGRRSCVLFTGRVFLDPSVRGSSLLQRVGAHYYWERLRENPFRRFYWMFDASTYKSYLLLPRNFHTFWPRRGATLPAREQAVFEALAGTLASWQFDPATGIVRHPHMIYVDGLVEREPEVLRDLDVAFYARLNPEAAQGAGLMCLCPLGPVNWATCLVRALQRAMRPRRAVRPVVEAARVVAQAIDTPRGPLQEEGRGGR